MTVITFRDGYRDVPPRNDQRAVLTHELRRLKVLLLSDASDAEFCERIAELEAELQALDRGSAA